MIIEVATSLVFVWLSWWIIKTYMERKGMPPGPIPLPVIGNMLQMRGGMASFEKLRQKYGDIYTVSLPHGTTVVVNSAELGYESLVTRKDDSAGRNAESVYPLHSMFKGQDIMTQEPGKTHTIRRKVFKTSIHAYGTTGLENAGNRNRSFLHSYLMENNSNQIDEIFYVR